jgi:tetratricopeptide (TPR) repeat protein
MRVFVTASLLLLALAARAAPAPAPAEARAYKEIGDQRRKAGDPDAALEAYRTAIKKFGAYAEAYEAMGEVHYAQKRFTEAIEAFGYAVEIDPTYAFAWYNLAFAARKAPDLGRARAAYERYVKLRPSDPDGHYGLAETLRGLGEREGAIREYQLFVDLAKAIPAQAAWVEKARRFIAELKATPAGEQAPESSTGKGGTAAVVLASPGAVLAPAASAAAAPAGATASGAAAPALTATPTAGPPPIPTTTIPTATATPSPTATTTPSPTATATPTPTATTTPSPTATATPTPTATRPVPSVPVAAPTQALVEKLGAGDRSFLAGDHRSALFLYQDAAYLDPTSVAARIRLARCYAALRYPAQAEGQLKQALEIDPGNAEARKLLEELRTQASRPGLRPSGAAGPGTAAATPAAPPRIYRLTPDGSGPAAGEAAPPAGVTAPQVTRLPEPVAASAPDLYREGVARIGRREFVLAIESFNRALEKDPGLTLAYEARASARFGLGQHREAAEDYQAALTGSPDRAAPLWGLAESYRLLGDARAAQAYQRYAASTAPDVVETQREQASRWAQELGER